MISNEHHLLCSESAPYSKYYLCKLNLWEGETTYSTKSGFALTLAWMGIDKASIKQHVGWKSDSMFHHYTAGNDMCSRYAYAKALSVEQNKTTRQNIYEFQFFKKNH